MNEESQTSTLLENLINGLVHLKKQDYNSVSVDDGCIWAGGGEVKDNDLMRAWGWEFWYDKNAWVFDLTN